MILHVITITKNKIHGGCFDSCLKLSFQRYIDFFWFTSHAEVRLSIWFGVCVVSVSMCESLGLIRVIRVLGVIKSLLLDFITFYKRQVAKAKLKAYDWLYEGLNTQGGGG